MERPKWTRTAARLGAAFGLGFLLQSIPDQSLVKANSEEPQVITRGNTQRAEVALTFDCGPWVNEDYIASILDALDQYQIRSTIFVTGEFLEKYKEKRPDILARIVKSHELANHTFSHLDHSKQSEEVQRLQLRWTEESVNKYNITTKPFWRPPFGAWNKEVINIASEEGYPLTIMWTTDSGDWIANKPAEAVKATVLANVYNGSIIVSHCNSPQTAQVLPSILWHLREWGIKATTVSQVIS